MTNLITEARELCAIDIENQPIHAEVIIDELCDALENAQEHNKQLIREVSELACESVEREKALAKLEAEVMAKLKELKE
jgi:predicted phage gp36 major capsid-like protein